MSLLTTESRPGVASNAMCTFLAITASIQLIPTTAIGILAINGSRTPRPAGGVSATVIGACSGVFSAKLFERLPMFRLAPVQPATRTDSMDAPAETRSNETVQTTPLNLFKIWTSSLRQLLC